MSQQKVLIIGGGSTGLATGLEISRSKKAQVIILEKDYVGAGQTGQCCGFVRNFYNVPEMIISASYSMNKIIKLCKKNKELIYERKGLIVLDNLNNRKSIKENVVLLKKFKVKAKYLEQAQINKINPFLAIKNSCAGYDINAGYINPQLVIDYLKNECIKNGVKISEKTKVLKITKVGKKFRIGTNRSNFLADKVFNATAGYTNTINKMLNFSLPVKTIKINNTFYRLPLGPQRYLTGIADFENGFYIIPHEDFIDVSTMELDLKKTVDPEKEEVIFNHDAINDNRKLIAKRIIGAEKSAVLGGFGSHLDVTSDYYPILSAIDEIPNYYCAAGFSGTGFKHFPMIGKLMKEIILEEESYFPNLVKFFRYNRFNKGKIRHNVRDSYFIKE